MKFKKINDLALDGKIVFIRTDMNVPIKNQEITDNTRILAGLKTIEFALSKGAKVIVATHLGRPTEGQYTASYSVAIVARNLGVLLKTQIPVIKNISKPIDFTNTNIVMLENVRLNIGEKKNDQTLGQQYASLCDVFVHDAFATSHRAEASTDSIGYYTKETCAGLLMSSELNALTHAFANPVKPIIAIVAGSKVSTKLTVLKNLAASVDCLIVGGGILNTFLLANGIEIGKSLAEPNLIEQAKQIMQKMSNRGATVPLPHDVVTAKEFSETAIATIKDTSTVSTNDMILDIGPNFSKQLAKIIETAGTIIWNGPVGVFEFERFATGTKTLATNIANSKAFSLAGGGDTIAAINKFKVFDEISYVSTAGGALLEFLEGKELPAIKLLKDKA